MRVFIQALKGTVIHLVQSEYDESDTSDMEASDSSLPQDRSELDPLNLTQGGPEREEGECSNQSSSPEAMDQDDVLGHDTYLDGGSASNTGMASGRVLTLSPRIWTLLPNPRGLKVAPSGPWRARMHGTTVAILTPRGAKERTRWPNAIDCTLRYGPTRSLHQ